MSRHLRNLLWLVVGFFVGGAFTYAHAGFATPTQTAIRTGGPSGFQAGGPSVPFTFGGGQVTFPMAVNIAGQVVQIQGAAKLAPMAGQVAVGAIKANPTAVLNPGGLVAGALVNWLLSQGVQWAQNQWQSTLNAPSPDWWSAGSNCATGYGSSATAACQDSVAKGKACFLFPSDMVFQGANISGNDVTCTTNKFSIFGSKVTTCPAGQVYSGGKCIPATYPPPGDGDWSRVANNFPGADPQAVQQLAQTTPLPVDPPSSQPTSKPIGPVRPNPLNPSQLIQPTAQITPSPTPTDPLRVEIQIVNQPVQNQAGDPTPGAVPQKPDNPCDQNPDAIGCSNWGDPEDSDLKEKEKNVQLQPDSGWGPDNGSCPADLTYTPHLTGKAVTFSYQPVCQYATTLRPVVIGMAWITATLIFLGIARRAQG